MSAPILASPTDPGAAAWSAPPELAERPDRPGLYLALAPMDGVTDSTYRALIGSVDARRTLSATVTEFVRVAGAPIPPAVLAREVPELAHGARTAAGLAVHVQLLGSQPEAMAQTAASAARLGATVVDLNFGCPAKTVNRHDGGAVLLKTPERIERVTAAVRAALPAEVAVSVKIRVGWDHARDVGRLAQAAERGGASWLTIHARTRVQGYAPPVDWPAIGAARAAVEIPVVANGDLFSLADLTRCAAVTGCRAFMIGRGALAHPDLFGRIRRGDPHPMAPARLAELLVDHDARLAAAGAGPAARLGRAKQWLRLAASARAELGPIFAAVKRCESVETLLADLAARAR